MAPAMGILKDGQEVEYTAYVARSDRGQRG